MAVNPTIYANKLEQLLNQGVPMEEAHRRASEYASIKTTATNKRKKDTLAQAIVRKARELRYGPETYLSEEQRKERRERLRKKKKDFKSIQQEKQESLEEALGEEYVRGRGWRF